MTLETDGAWVRTFPAGRETTYHAAMQALKDGGYAIVGANQIGGSFRARSEVTEVGFGLWYRLAHVVVEPSLEGDGTRVRLGMVTTREAKGVGREPNNDQPVRDLTEYEEIFRKIEEILNA